MQQNLQAEITAIRSQIVSLKQERAAIVIPTISPEDNSPEAITNAYRRLAKETAELSAEIKGIDDAISFLEAQLQEKEAILRGVVPRRKSSVEEQLEEDRERAHAHAERINQLAAELAEEIKALKAIADEISPSYWQVYYKPFITGFKSISVPQVRSDGEVWTIMNRLV